MTEEKWKTDAAKNVTISIQNEIKFIEKINFILGMVAGCFVGYIVAHVLMVWP